MSELIPTVALSFSRLSDYESCPLKFKQKYITKEFPDDSDNPAFVKGNAIHKQLEDYILYKTSTDLPKPVMSTFTQPAVPMIDGLYEASDGNIFPEKQIAVDQEWNLCTWFDKPHKVKYRAIIDCLVFLDEETLLIIDWKSGKFRAYEEGPTTQLKLTAAILFSLYPKVKKITSSYMFVEHKRTVKVDFTRDMLETLKGPFNDKHAEVNQAARDDNFPFRKNKWCNWCATNDCPVKKK